MPETITQESVDASEVLIAEYDTSGILHRFVEIKVDPPYLWCARSYREPEGIQSRFIPILPGYERIWQHRVLMHTCVYPQSDPRFVPQWLEDCMLFGRRRSLDGAEDVLLIYPDGTPFKFRSIAEAMAHRR